MHALSSHSFETSSASRFANAVWQFLHSLSGERSATLPAELGRLPEHLLRDIGVDPRAVASEHAGAVTPPDMLHSPRAMAEFLATTVR